MLSGAGAIVTEGAGAGVFWGAGFASAPADCSAAGAPAGCSTVGSAEGEASWPTAGSAVEAVSCSVTRSGDVPSTSNCSLAGSTACSVAAGASDSWALTGTAPTVNTSANPSAPARTVRGTVDRNRPVDCERVAGTEKRIVLYSEVICGQAPHVRSCQLIGWAANLRGLRVEVAIYSLFPTAGPLFEAFMRSHRQQVNFLSKPQS